MNEILISLKPKHASKLLSGEKTIELRCRKLNIAIKTKAWIYITCPVGRIEAFAIIDSIEYDEPSIIWNKYQRELCITYEEFLEYVNGRHYVSAIRLSGLRQAVSPISLASIRASIGRFNPPQFFVHIAKKSPLQKMLCRIDVGDTNG